MRRLGFVRPPQDFAWETSFHAGIRLRFSFVDRPPSRLLPLEVTIYLIWPAVKLITGYQQGGLLPASLDALRSGRLVLAAAQSEAQHSGNLEAGFPDLFLETS